MRIFTLTVFASSSIHIKWIRQYFFAYKMSLNNKIIKYSFNKNATIFKIIKYIITHHSLLQEKEKSQEKSSEKHIHPRRD